MFFGSLGFTAPAVSFCDVARPSRSGAVWFVHSWLARTFEPVRVGEGLAGRRLKLKANRERQDGREGCGHEREPPHERLLSRGSLEIRCLTGSGVKRS